MAVRPVHLIGDDILREVSSEVNELTPGVSVLIEDMFDTMYDKDGVGLAAPQVGELLRIIVVDTDGKHPLCLINPVIVKMEMMQIAGEKCLSVPGLRLKVRRPGYIVVKGRDRNFKEVKIEAYGERSRCICHEIDHLDGILFTDKMVEF